MGMSQRAQGSPEIMSQSQKDTYHLVSITHTQSLHSASSPTRTDRELERWFPGAGVEEMGHPGRGPQSLRFAGFASSANVMCRGVNRSQRYWSVYLQVCTTTLRNGNRGRSLTCSSASWRWSQHRRMSNHRPGRLRQARFLQSAYLNSSL